MCATPALGQATIVQTVANHRELQRFLNACEYLASRQVVIEMTGFRMEEKALIDLHAVVTVMDRRHD